MIGCFLPEGISWGCPKVTFGSDKLLESESSPGISGNLSSSVIKNIYYCIFSDEQRRKKWT